MANLKLVAKKTDVQEMVASECRRFNRIVQWGTIGVASALIPLLTVAAIDWYQTRPRIIYFQGTSECAYTVVYENGTWVQKDCEWGRAHGARYGGVRPPLVSK